MVLGLTLLVLAQHAAAAPQVFHVSDFGAKADSNADSGPAIRRAPSEPDRSDERAPGR